MKSQKEKLDSIPVTRWKLAPEKLERVALTWVRTESEMLQRGNEDSMRLAVCRSTEDNSQPVRVIRRLTASRKVRASVLSGWLKRNRGSPVSIRERDSFIGLLGSLGIDRRGIVRVILARVCMHTRLLCIR